MNAVPVSAIITPLKAPFPWFGGKSRAAQLIWSRLGDVSNYVEPFAGSLAVLLARPHEPRIETVNDFDAYLSNFWRALSADPDQVAHYCDWPVNETDLHARHLWLCSQTKFRERMLTDPSYFDAKIAGWWVWGISQWIGSGWCSHPEWVGRGQGGRADRGVNTLDARRPNAHPMGVLVKRPHLSGSGSTGVHRKRPMLNHSGRGLVQLQRSHLNSRSSGIACHKNKPAATWSGRGTVTNRSLIDWMLSLSERLRRVRVCCGDWSRIVTPSCTHKVGGGTLTGVLLDPPYGHHVRDNRLYSIDADIAAAVRDWAVDAGANSRMRIALCGLDGEHQMPADWSVAEWKAPRGYSNKAPRHEVIWFSPHCLKQENLFS